MERLISAATSSGGLGTAAARLAFLFGLGCGLLQGLVDGSIAADPLRWTAALGAALVGALILTKPGSQPLTPPLAGGVVAIAGMVAVVTLSSAPAVTNLAGLGLAAYLATFLIVRGNVLAGVAGSVLVLGLAAGWAWPQRPSVQEWALLLGIPIGSVLAAVAWRLVLRWIVRRERLHRTDAARADERAEADADALDAARVELAEIGLETTALLHRIAAGEWIDDNLRAELTFVEAVVRDRIRAPRLSHPMLLSAVAALRRDGVEVVLLGERSAGEQRLPDDLAAAIVASITPVAQGRVTVRALPEGRAAAASVVISGAGTATTHLEFSANGTMLVRA